MNARTTPGSRALTVATYTGSRSWVSPVRSRGLTASAQRSSSTLLRATTIRFDRMSQRAGSASPSPPDAKLAGLRAAMAQAASGTGVAAYIIPSEDPHMSEYSAECHKRREFISGFNGSAGTAVVTETAAALWTDGRYFLQAERQLGKEWTLMRSGQPGVPEIADWLAETLPPNARVGIDPFCHTIDSVRSLKTTLEAHGKQLVPLLDDGNLVDRVWGSAQPQLPDTPVRLHPAEWAGETVAEKLLRMRQQMKQSKADVLLVSMLDEVAWLFNLRGSDVECNPVFISYGLVTHDTATLYVDSRKVTPQVAAHLKEGGVQVAEYSKLLTDVRQLAGQGQVFWMDATKVSYAVQQAAKDAFGTGPRGRGTKRKAEQPSPPASPAPAAAAANGAAEPAAAQAPLKQVFVEQPSPVVIAKAIKNPAELAGMREAHLRDAVALCEFFSFVEREVARGRTFTEVEVDKELTARRAQQQGFIELSFPTIAGAGPHGAIIHYRATEATARTVDANTLLLLDSGGQYDCGTTDITRTMHFGTPTAHQRACYTRVMQGHIALDKAVFPEGTPGTALDTLARVPLWRQGLNYRHGTGHGVGAALNVHEGPQSISTRYWITTPLQANMVCSNEPGYYEDGSFGVRIENLVVVKEVDTEFRYGGSPFFGFERLTMVPMQVKLLDADIMTEEEIKWMDDYHSQVWQQVSPRLSGDVLQWLKKRTRPVREQLGDM